ncbi:hypothetical protein NRB20_11170 [Nocardia sp. RB20]|uniref:Uncharacterized protein n=1 Tax=Nocardia macrotermitis TaxID=2585198 RepID=A0A7K0CX92_9NOCA|nr:hypothetical protein [Nocardia macrotermitis]
MRPGTLPDRLAPEHGGNTERRGGISERSDITCAERDFAS